MTITIKINQNLYEFINNKDKNNHFDNKNNSKKKNLKFNLNNDSLSSERTINNNSSDGEYFLDDLNTDKNKYKDKNRNFNNFKNKNNIFGNVKEYKINNNGKKIGMSKLKTNNKKNEKNNINNKNQLKNYNQKYSQYKNNNSMTKINNLHNSNLFLISTFLPNKNRNKNKINKHYSYGKIIKIDNSKDKENFKTITNFSNKNILENNKDTLQGKNQINNNFKENNKFKPSENNSNDITQQTKDRDNSETNSINQVSSNNYSYNNNNFYICNDSNYNLYEKQKMSELIEKIPNNELKNEIKFLYQKIINYKNKVIINNKNNNFDYIVTFSNNYIKIEENNLFGKKTHRNKLIIKNAIKISLISKKEIDINNNDNYYTINNNKIYNNISNHSSFNQYINNIQNLKGNNTNNNKNSKNNIENNIENDENDKLKNNDLNKTWKKIISLSDVIINKDKIFQLSFIEKDNKLTKTVINTRKNSNNKLKRNYSMNCKSSQGYENSDEDLEIKPSTSIDINNYKISNINLNRFGKFYNISLDGEIILFENNMNKLINVYELLKNIKNSKNNKNKTIKEDNLVMLPVICILSRDSFIIFKDKEKIYPLFKKNLNLIKRINIFKRAYKYIVIINFINLNINEIKDNENEEKDNNIIGLLIDKKKSYKEFIQLLKQLIPNVEIIFLN